MSSTLSTAHRRDFCRALYLVLLGIVGIVEYYGLLCVNMSYYEFLCARILPHRNSFYLIEPYDYSFSPYFLVVLSNFPCLFVMLSESETSRSLS